MVRAAVIAFALGCGLPACGGAPAPKADDGKPKLSLPCAVAAKAIKGRLGPEFHSVVRGVPLSLALPPKVNAPGEAPSPQPPAQGCALVFLPVSEELPGEVDGAVALGDDQRLAFALPHGGGALQVSVAPASKHTQWAAKAKITVQELTGDRRDEVVVEWTGRDAKGQVRALQIFALAPDSGQATVLLDTPMYMQTPEGLDMIPTWTAGSHAGAPAIVFDAVGIIKTFAWDGSAARFVEVVVAPAPPEPPTPTPGAAPGEPGSEPSAEPEAGPSATP